MGRQRESLIYIITISLEVGSGKGLSTCLNNIILKPRVEIQVTLAAS